jgi:hypothetical protein
MIVNVSIDKARDVSQKLTAILSAAALRVRAPQLPNLW